MNENLKKFIRFLFSIFFLAAILVHVKSLIDEEEKQFLLHSMYFITYGVCWAMIFYKNKYSYLIFLLMAAFPFYTHLKEGYEHFNLLDITFLICALVCFMLTAGVFWTKKYQ